MDVYLLKTVNAMLRSCIFYNNVIILFKTLQEEKTVKKKSLYVAKSNR